MLVVDAIEYLRRSIMLSGSRREMMELVVAVHRPGTIGLTPSVNVLGVDGGIDWDAGRVLIRTNPEVSALTDHQRAAIMQSVRQSQSWHAYRAQKRLRERICELEAEVARLRAAATE